MKQHGPDLSVCLGVQPCGGSQDMQLALGLKGLESAVSFKVGHLAGHASRQSRQPHMCIPYTHDKQSG